VFAALAVLIAMFAFSAQARAQDGAVRLDEGRFTFVAYPPDELLAKSLLAAAVARDTFPGLPRPTQRVIIAIAPDKSRFRAWTGPNAPEWGAAVAFPESSRIVMQGRDAGSDAGDPIEVLRHELAHLALHEALGDLPPRWFDEGYASYTANEVARDAVLGANLALLFRGMPALDSLDVGFAGGSLRAQGTYALAYRAVAELAAQDPERGLTLFFKYWKETGRFESAIRRAYGLTQGQFEEVWRARTRRRYGGLALVADMSIAAAVTLFVVMPFYVIRRRRDRLRMAALVRADEEAERRERQSIIEALLRSIVSPVAGSGDASGSPPAPPPDESSSPPKDA
jgi:peptidase MA superfamily protein